MSSHQLNHVYTYTNFVPRTPEAGLFVPPNFCRAPIYTSSIQRLTLALVGIVTRAAAIVQQEPLLAGAVLIAGMAIGIMLSSIMACIIIRYKSNKQSSIGDAAVGAPRAPRGSEFNNLKEGDEEDLRL